MRRGAGVQACREFMVAPTQESVAALAGGSSQCEGAGRQSSKGHTCWVVRPQSWCRGSGHTLVRWGSPVRMWVPPVIASAHERNVWINASSELLKRWAFPEMHQSALA